MIVSPISESTELVPSRLKSIFRRSKALRLQKYQTDPQVSLHLEALCSNVSEELPVINISHCRFMGGMMESPYSCQLLSFTQYQSIIDENAKQHQRDDCTVVED